MTSTVLREVSGINISYVNKWNADSAQILQGL